MKLSSFILCTLFVVSLYSCSNNNNDIIDTQNCSVIKVPDFSPSDTTIVPSPYYDSEYIVKLSNEDKSLIGQINKMDIAHNSIFILDCWKAKRLNRYSMDGKYITSYGSLGSGNGEYTGLNSFDVIDSLVVIYDNYNQNLLFYDLDNTFIKSKKVPFFASAINIVSPNRYIWHLTTGNNHLPDVNGYELIITDSTFNIINKFLYHDPDQYTNNYGCQFSGKDYPIYVSMADNDTVYSILNDDQIKAEFIFDYGKYHLPYELRLNKNSKLYEEDQVNKQYKMPCGFYKLNDLLYFTYCLGRRVYSNIYSIKNDKLISYACSSYETISLAQEINFLYSYDNTLVSYFFPSDYSEWKEPLNKGAEVREKAINLLGIDKVKVIENLKEDDNVYLVFTKFKDF